MGVPPVCFAPGDGLIDPSVFPARSGDLDTEAIRGSATHLRGLGTMLVTRTDMIALSWNGLAPCYVAPESDRVLALMGPVTMAAGSVDDAYVAVAGHLDTYASELDAIKPKLADLERRAAAFRNEVKDGVETSLVGEVEVEWWSSGLTMLAAGVEELTEDWKTVPWYEHGPTVEKNDGFWLEFANLVEQITGSVATCANAINRLADPLVCTAPYEALPAEAIMSGAISNWGGPRAEERGCVEQVSDGTAEFTTGLAQGVGGLVVGYDPTTGEFGWDGFSQAWGGLGNLVWSVGVTATAGVVWSVGDMAGVNWVPGFDSFVYDRAVVLRDVGASLVSYDPYAQGGDGWHLWKEEGWKQGTIATLNVATFFIPGAGEVGAGVKGARAAQVARFAGAAADVVADGGSWAVKGILAAGRGVSTLAKGQGWAAAVDAARFTTGGARITGMGGISANGVQAVHDLTNIAPPTIHHPSNLPRVTDSLVPPVRPRNTGLGARVDGVHLSDDAIRRGTDSWVNQQPPVDVVDQLPVRVPERELVGVGARPGDITNSVATTTRPESGAGAHVDSDGTVTGNGRSDGGAGSGGGGGLSDGSTPEPRYHPESGKPVWDKNNSPRETLSQSEAGRAPDYSPEDVERAYENAPVNEHGQPVDHRNGKPLNLPDANGRRQWQMAWDPEAKEWVAQNPGKGQNVDGWAQEGPAGSFGYDSNGQLMRYITDRPNYAPGQVVDVWRNASNAWSRDSVTGAWVKDLSVPDRVRVTNLDGSKRWVAWDSEASPLPGRSGPDGWDMGHLEGHEYRDLVDEYLNHRLGRNDAENLEEFLRRYQDASRYEPQDPSRNRSHIDEAP